MPQPNVSAQAAFSLLKLAVPKLDPMGVTKLTPSGLSDLEHVSDADLVDFFGEGPSVSDIDGCDCSVLFLVKDFLKTLEDKLKLNHDVVSPFEDLCFYACVAGKVEVNVAKT